MGDIISGYLRMSLNNSGTCGTDREVIQVNAGAPDWPHDQLKTLHLCAVARHAAFAG
jgi:hypothetical protein